MGSGSSHGRRSPIDEAPKIMNLQVDKVAQAGFTGVMQLRDHPLMTRESGVKSWPRHRNKPKGSGQPKGFGPARRLQARASQ
jgi:hypothetical protein